MIPSLVVSEIRSALVEYLASTFALSDNKVRQAVSDFLQDEAEGIFRGPYLRVRTPFRSVDSTWQSPLDWLPDGFLPYQHQAAAFDRLSTNDDRSASPTLVTTGTGSGKTECFLYPVLDHCARMKAAGQTGVKALILYPMNALASDQAGRLAKLISAQTRLAGVTAGIYVGEQGHRTSVSADGLIDKREVMRAEPPDILLTNYKMLDFLLLRSEDRELWAANDADTLKYVVLDEFHTYDGAQGTDVAMLLRRLGSRLKMDTADAPLGNAIPVATSATLGTGQRAIEELRDFASKIFGSTFHADSVIGETRQTVEEACGPVNYALAIPDAADVAGLTDEADLSAIFCSDPENPSAIEDTVELGTLLVGHPLTRAILHAVSDRSRSWSEAVAEIVAYAPNWGRSLMTGDAQSVELALAKYLQLLSAARRPGDRPLFSVEVQLWVREVSRLLRTVSTTPKFRWRDSAAATQDDASTPIPGSELPAIYCRRCGMSGWMALASESSDAYSINPSTIYGAALTKSPLIRAIVRCHPDDVDRQWYSPADRRLVEEPDDQTVSVLVTPSEDDALANRCPSCHDRNSIRFLGLAVASLASVSINTLFASQHLEEKERKLLAFTDSVQDASHRAAFFGGRTHRMNLRALMARVIKREETVSLADLGDLILAEAETKRDRFGLVPPDLTRHAKVSSIWQDKPEPGAQELLAERLHFETDMEFGLRSRVGRTLELSRVAAAHVEVDDIDPLISLIGEETQRLTGETRNPKHIATYLQGLLERMRLQGGLYHQMLKPFIESGGKHWHLWGGRPDGLPPFTEEQGRPNFFTTATKGDLATVTAPPTNNPTWVVDWAKRTLGLEPVAAQNLNAWTLNLLSKETDTVLAKKANAGTVFALDRHFVMVSDVETDAEGGPEGSVVKCNICGGLHVASPTKLADWVKTPCLRYRCVGHYEVAPPIGAQYYRSLYRSGITRRVVTGEHTGLLNRANREALEKSFKEGTEPNAPNLITATPTLEMGIDIGDLSAVMLTSVPRNPASYIQRVGRAGRSTGNSLVTAFVRTDSHGLYYLADPEAMLSGDVRPPSCYLDAVETLQRQFVAYMIDRVADQAIEAPVPAAKIGSLMRTGLDDSGFFKSIIEASTNDPTYGERFLATFANQLEPSTVSKIKHFASSGIEQTISDAVADWDTYKIDLGDRRTRLTRAIDRLVDKGVPADDPNLGSLKGQRAAVIGLLKKHRDEYWISALERLGLLPNYTLIDDGIELEASMWYQDSNGDFNTDTLNYKRSGRLAIREFAPGNSFYAGGHRHKINSLEIGTAQEPLYEDWRLCPECGYATIEPKGEPPKVCPRCASKTIADTGASHTMLRLKKSFASGSEENARVFDESDARRNERYDMVLAVDVEPETISGAWMLDERAFGAEFAARTHLRTVNLGFETKAGRSMPIAGKPRHVTGFTVCSHCGAVAEVRDDNKGSNPERLHEGSCKARSGSVKEKWDNILLLHELTTEAIRMLIPVSMFEFDERLATFKGALLLGLREDFGGDPAHLEVALADMPNRSGQGRKRFMVLYDAVPGGTGYLARIAEPERMKTILQAGLEVIARCLCTTEGRQACHRCLLGVVDRTEYDLVRRDLAIEMLEDLLNSWDPELQTTIANADIGKVEESELERRFKVAIRDWATSNPGENITWKTVPGKGKYQAFELSLELGGISTRYRIDEQEGLATTPSTVPDYVIRRMDDKGPEVAVYLDGYQYHASHEHSNIAADAQKRRGVRDDNRLVWNLVWDDVEAFHKASIDDPPRQPPPKTLLKGKARTAAQTIRHHTDGYLDVDVINQNPMALLIDYLSRPNPDHWARLTLTAVGAMAVSGDWNRAVTADGVEELVRSGIAGVEPRAAVDGDGPEIAQAYRVTTSNDLPMMLVLDTRHNEGRDERWTAICSLDDTMRSDEKVHRRRWQDWLHWANILQFLPAIGRDAILSATSEVDDYPVEDLWLLDLSKTSSDDATQAATISEEMEEELDLLEDHDVEELIRRALERGVGDFVAGEELEGNPVEAAWPDQKVAVLRVGQEAFSTDGWDARPPTEWNIEELVAVLEERS